MLHPSSSRARPHTSSKHPHEGFEDGRKTSSKLVPRPQRVLRIIVNSVPASRPQNRKSLTAAETKAFPGVLKFPQNILMRNFEDRQTPHPQSPHHPIGVRIVRIAHGRGDLRTLDRCPSRGRQVPISSLNVGRAREAVSP